MTHDGDRLKQSVDRLENRLHAWIAALDTWIAAARTPVYAVGKWLIIASLAAVVIWIGLAFLSVFLLVVDERLHIHRHGIDVEVNWTLVGALLQCLVIILAVLTPFTDDWGERRNRLVLGVLVLIGGFGGLFAIYQSFELRRDVAESTQAVATATSKLEGSLGNLERAKREIATRQSLIARLEEQILNPEQIIFSRVSREISADRQRMIDAITGADAFPVMKLKDKIVFDGNDSWEFTFEGSVPLRNVDVRVFDEPHLSPLAGRGYGSVFPGRVLYFDDIRWEGLQRRSWVFWFTTANGIWVQRSIAVMFHDKRPRAAHQVHRVAFDNDRQHIGAHAGKLVYELIDDEFPRNNRGEVEWTEYDLKYLK